MSYGSGPKRLPLADVLQYALEFASSKPVCTSPVDDLDSSAPPGGATGPLGLLSRFLKNIFAEPFIINMTTNNSNSNIQLHACFHVAFHLCHYPSTFRPTETDHVFTAVGQNQSVEFVKTAIE